MEQWAYTVVGNSCNWCCLVYFQACYLTTEGLWASTALPTIMLLCPSMVPLLAHHQMLCDCNLAKPDSRTKKKGLASQDCGYSVCRLTWMCLMAEISAWSSVSSLCSLSVHFDPWPLLNLTTLVAAFLNSSKLGSYAWYYSWSPAGELWVLTVASRYRTRKNSGNIHCTCLYGLCSEIKALDTY